MKRNIVITLLILVLVLVGVLAHRAGRNFRMAQASISSIPSFKLLLLDSTTVFDTKNIVKGKPTLFVYFSPDCEHCQRQTKELIDNIGSFTDVQIYLFTPSEFSDLKRFDSTFRLYKYKNIIVAQDLEYGFYKYFKAVSFPYVAVYDRQKELTKLYKNEISIQKIIETTHI